MEGPISQDMLHTDPDQAALLGKEHAAWESVYTGLLDWTLTSRPSLCSDSEVVGAAQIERTISCFQNLPPY